MSLKDQIQDAIKAAMKAKEAPRLECLRMIKGALLLKEKESSDDLTEAVEVTVLRSEVRKRQQTLEILQEHAKIDEIAATEAEIAVIEEFLPQQLTLEALEEKARAYLAEHPEINHAGKLTGALKKELGDQADGKMLNEVCRKVLEG
jgi:hypothetical protein